MANVSKINFNGETLDIKDAHARDQLAHLTADNYTADIAGDYTINAGDISMTSKNATMHTTADREIDTDGNDSVHIDGASTLNVGGLRTETFTGDKTEAVTGTTTEIYSSTHTETNKAKKIENAKDKILNVENLEINATNPVKYKKPVTKNNLVTIPMQDTDGNEYDILCAGTKLGSPTFSPYLFVGHKEANDTSLIVGYTTDFTTFIPMAQFDNIIARDPQMIYLNGTFYVSCTYYIAGTSYDTVIFTTRNFKTWKRHEIDLGVTDGPTWAPELAVNNGTLYIFYAHGDTGTNMKLYRSACTDINTLTFTAGTLVNGLSGTHIDPSIYHNDTYNYTVLIAKDESNKRNYWYDYNFDTNTCGEAHEISFPPHTEAVSCYSWGRYVAIIGDRYFSPGETGYSSQNIMSTITSDLRNSALTLKTTNCFYNPAKDKMSGLRHVSCLQITEDMVDVLTKNIGPFVPVAVNRENPYPEHVNIEDFGTLNGTTVTVTDFIPYPNTVYCIFNNPTGLLTNTTQVNITSINNYFNLFDLYIYIGSTINKSLTINTREGTTTINLTNADLDRFIHLRQGIDTRWSVVKGY